MVSFIGITSGNGGMGKSSLACNLALGLSLMGKKVLLIETKFGIRSYDAILGIKPETFSSFSDYCDAKCQLSDIITKPDGERLPDFIWGGNKCPEGDVKKALFDLKNAFLREYDFIISDVSPINENIFSAFKKLCDVFLVLTDASFVSLRNSAYCVNSIKEKTKAKVYAILNKVIIDGADESAFVEDVLDELGCNLLGIIPYDEHFSYSIEKSEPIYKYNTFAGRAFENICKRLLGQAVSDYETGLGGGFFKKDKFVLKQFI